MYYFIKKNTRKHMDNLIQNCIMLNSKTNSYIYYLNAADQLEYVMFLILKYIFIPTIKVKIK